MSELVLVNPRRRKTRRRTTRKRATRRAPVKRRRVTRRRRAAAKRPTRRRRVRRNPKLTFRNVTRDALVPAAIGATGALALDITLGFVPLPANLKTGPIGSVTKIVGAIILGKVAGNFMSAKRGEQITAGAITVLAYDAFKKMIAQNMPGVPLSGSDFAYNPYVNGMGEYVGTSGQLGYMNAGTGVSAQPPMQTGEYVPSDGMGEYDYD